MIKMRETKVRAMSTKPESQTTGYIKVGRISMSIARQAHVKCADIMIDNRHIEHINKKHRVELDTLGISAIEFVKLIVSTFGEIRQAHRLGVAEGTGSGTTRDLSRVRCSG